MSSEGWKNPRVLRRLLTGNFRQWYALRNDFKAMFYDAAAKSGVEIHLGRPVRAVDDTRPAVVFEDGAIVEADLVIGGDGLWIGNTYSRPR